MYRKKYEMYITVKPQQSQILAPNGQTVAIIHMATYFTNTSGHPDFTNISLLNWRVSE